MFLGVALFVSCSLGCERQPSAANVVLSIMEDISREGNYSCAFIVMSFMVSVFLHSRLLLLFVQKKSDVDVPPDRVRMSSDGHEMTILSEPGGGELAKEAGVGDGADDVGGGGVEIFEEEGSWDLADELRIDGGDMAYNRSVVAEKD